MRNNYIKNKMLFIKYAKCNCDISDANPMHEFVSSFRQLSNIGTRQLSSPR